MTKTCTKCKTAQEISEFYKNSRYSDGYVTWCKTCKKTWTREHPETTRKRVAGNSTRVKAIKIKYVDNNKDKVNEAKRAWQRTNPKAQLALTRKYQASKLSATPSWLTKEQHHQMRQFYENCPKGSHVDHVVPLQGDNVRGLHVPWNLQYLSAKENLRKGNKFQK